MTRVDATRGYVDESVAQLRQDLIDGLVQIPVVTPVKLNFAGGTNHAPNSDLSFSTAAARVAGTLPGTAGDDNQEAYRFFRQLQGDPVAIDDLHALKAVAHSLFAANEGASPEIPIWNRILGYIEAGGAAGHAQYDIALQLLSKVVAPGQRWFFRVVLAVLNPALVPVDMQLYGGVWVDNSGVQGWAKGDPFDLSYVIHGQPGTTNTDYRVLAKTDTGVTLLSNILNVPDAPDALTSEDYPTIFFNGGPGFIEYSIFRRRAGIFSRLFVLRNATDLHYHDTGGGTIVSDWPPLTGPEPIAYNQRKQTLIGGFGQTWLSDLIIIDVPRTYASSLTDSDGQFLRFGFTAPAGVDRHIGIDHVWFSTTNNEWSPDVLPPFADGTRPIPSASPDTGDQGGGDGIFDPPETCITTRLPVLMKSYGNYVYRPFSETKEKQEIKGEHKRPYVIIDKLLGQSPGYYLIKTANDIEYECNGRHRLVLDSEKRISIEAQHVKVGTLLEGETRGRRIKTNVTSIRYIPEPVDVGTYRLRHSAGLQKDGEGIYLAGRSPAKDRGLYCFNLKRFDPF